MLTPKVTAITHAGPSPYAPVGRQSGSDVRVVSGSPWVSPRAG